MPDDVLRKMNNAVWKCASNHLNVALMLSIGMIPSASILGKKYYKDSLSWFDGYIPVFKKIPSVALEEAVSEDKNTLRPCIISFKKGLINTIISQGVTELPVLINGHWQVANVYHEIILKAEMLLIPAPVSLSGVDKVLFQSIEDKVVFEDRIADSVNGLSLVSKVSEKEFSYNNEYSIQYYQSQPKDLIGGIPQLPPLNFNVANAMVAVINHLVILSRTNQLASKLLAYVKDGKPSFDLNDRNEKLLLEIGDWIRELGQDSSSSSPNDSVFIQLCQQLIEHKQNTNYGSHKDIILVALESLSNNNEQSLNFVETLRNYLQFSNHSMQQLLDQYPQNFRRAILLFVSKDDVLELWNKVGIYNTIEPFDMLLASILFAISKGWQGLSHEFKSYANNVVPMQNLLVLFSKNINIQSHPSIMNDLNLPLEGVWQGNYQGKLKKTVLSLITYHQLNCAEDEILLPEGVVFNARGSKIVLRTKAQSIKINTVIDESKFLEYLSGLNWFDFRQDELLQKLLTKK